MKSFGSIAVSVAALIFAKCAVAEDAPTTQAIVDAWKAREQKIESFDVSWWSKRTEAADPRSLVPSNVNPSNVHPKPESAAIWRYHFVMDRPKNRLFFEVIGRQWVIEKGDFIPLHVIETFDGKSYRTFYDVGVNSHRVFIKDVPTIPKRDYFEFYSRPIEVAFGPIIEGIELVPNTNNLVLAKETEPLEDLRVLIIGDNNFYTFRIDPKRDFLPLRCSTTHGTSDVITEISYEPNDLVGWVPKSWSRSGTGYSESATVRQCAINRPIAESQFELDLSGGALLQNNNTKPPSLSIIYLDGKKRDLKPGEDSKPFEELLKQEGESE
jgi:hypothetical protein